MAARLFSGLPKGAYKGGRTRLKLRFAGRKAVRKVQRYFGLGRYEAGHRLGKILDKTMAPPGTTSRGQAIMGISPRARKAQQIATSLVGKQEVRRRGFAVGGIGAVSGGLGAVAYKQWKKKRKTPRSRIRRT